MAGNRKTAFDRYLDERLKDEEFAREYSEARAEINTIDQIMRLLDKARKSFAANQNGPVCARLK